MEEVWMDIPNYEGLYQVSSLGRVRSLDRICITRGHPHRIKGHLMSPNVNNSGYQYLTLSKDAQHWYAKVHRLVAMAFIVNPHNLPEVNHKDGNKLNNCVDNLEWCTHSENHKHSYAMGTSGLEQIRNERQRKILQLDVQTGDVINEWNSIIEAERVFRPNKKNSSNIWSCLNGYHKIAYGYKWMYK